MLSMENKRFCQACGMPLDDNSVSSGNEKYCKWCWVDGSYVGASTIEEMIEVCLPHINWMKPDEAREFLQKQLPQLEHWKNQ